MRYVRCLAIIALVGVLIAGSTGIAAAKGPPEGNPGKGPHGHGKNQNFVGNVTSACEGNITFTAKQGWEVTMTLTEGTAYMVPSVAKGKVDFAGFIEAIGGNITALEGRRIGARGAGVVEGPEGMYTGDATRILVYPGAFQKQVRARLHAHRTGVVTAFSTDGNGNITIVDVHGVSHTFTMSGNQTIYRPQGMTASDVEVDESFVTVVTTGDPKLGPPAKAIVIHRGGIPEGWPGWTPAPTPTPEPGEPDLIISEKYEEWTGSGGNATYAVFYTVKNAGNATAPAGHDVGLTVDGSGMETKEVTVSLAPDEEHSDSFVIALTLSGESDDVEVCADVDSDVAESDETNNCLSNEVGPSHTPTTTT
jgi:hypothetical protein